MAVKPLNPTKTPDTKPDPMAFIEGAPRKPEPEPEPAKRPKDHRFFVYMDASLLERIDRECKKRGGIGRSTLLRLLAAEHLPE